MDLSDWFTRDVVFFDVGFFMGAFSVIAWYNYGWGLYFSVAAIGVLLFILLKILHGWGVDGD